MRLPTWLERAVALDPAGFAPGAALRAAVGVVAPLLIGAAIGHTKEGAVAAVGALPVGVAAMTSTVPVAPLGLLLTTTAGIAVSAFVGSLTAGHPAAVYPALALWGFAAGLLVVLGRAATVVGVQAVLGLVVFGRYPGGVSASAALAAAVVAGGLLQTLCALLLRTPRRYAAERLALADLFGRLAALALGRAYGGPSGEAVSEVSRLVQRRAPDNDTLRDLVDVATRIRLELQALKTVEDLPGVEEVTGAAAGWLRRVSASIDHGRAPEEEGPELEDAVTAVRDVGRARGRALTRRRFAAARAVALLGQLRAVDRLAAALAGERRLPLPRIAGVPSALELRGTVAGNAARLRETLGDPSRPAWRHAVRLAVLLPLSEALAQVLPWGRGYWVALTALVVLKPDYGTTVQRGIARVLGTALGVVLAGLLIAVLHPHGLALAAAVGVLAWASYAVFAVSFTVYSFVLTALVVMLVATGDPKPLSAVADRGLDTLVGGALALLGYLAWPTREEATLRATTAGLLEALAAYAEEVIAGYVAPDAVDRGRLGERARVARRARADAQASLDRANAEPERLRADTGIAVSVLAGARRTVIALHALRSTLQDAAEHVALPEAQPVADDVVAALRGLGEAVSSGAPVRMPDLRHRQQALEDLAAADAGSLRSRRLALVAAHLDPLVDAVDTIAHVLEGAGDDDMTRVRSPTPG